MDPDPQRCFYLTPFAFILSSVADPEWFIPEPDPALNFLCSGFRQKFRIHADPDPDPTYINKVYLGIIKTHTLNSIKKKNLTCICHSLFHTTVLQYKKQCCWSKYIEFGSGSSILTQFGSGSRVILSILKEKFKILLEKNNFL